MSHSFEDRERRHDEAIVKSYRGIARYFTEKRQVAWVALFAVIIWGIYGYFRMPKAKDPNISVRVAAAICAWPGARAERIEQLVTRKIEKAVETNPHIEKIEAISRTSVAIVLIHLKEDVADLPKEWSDIQGRLDGIHDMPDGTQPIKFLRDFGDTATLMLTVASPRVSEIELELRARSVASAIDAERAGASIPENRATLVASFPPEVSSTALQRVGQESIAFLATVPGVKDARPVDGPGFIGFDASTTLDDVTLKARLLEFVQERVHLSEVHPDVWHFAVIHDTHDTLARLSEVAGDRYTYKELERFTDRIERHLQRVDSVARVTRTGVLSEQIDLDYSQTRIAAYGLDVTQLSNVIGARNITAPGGILELGGKNIAIDPSGWFTDEKEIGGLVVAVTPAGAPVYLRDLVDVRREYQSPARYLNYLDLPEKDGKLARHRAITLAVDMRKGLQVGQFGKAVDAELEVVRKLLPEDLILQRTSDQPLQVKENVSLFLNSIYEAIALVVIVALIGFWDARTALILALTVPLTLALTFGVCQIIGIDIQQVSLAALIISLGLLVDVPVVASDGIKHALGMGWKRQIAAWLGPKKLAVAIFFATITNVASYFPFLILSGDTGQFLYSLPIVLTVALLAAFLVSMTLVPLLGSTILRATPETPVHERRARGFGNVYSRLVGWAIDHRLATLGIAFALLGVGFVAGGHAIKTAFFPKDLQYLSYVDVWLPEDAPLRDTEDRVAAATAIIREVCAEYEKSHGEPVLASVTEFIGGGGPRFWFSVTPELEQLNYAQLIIQVHDKEVTQHLVPLLQARLEHVAGARIDVRELETGKPVGIPFAMRISGEDISTLRSISARLKAIIAKTPGARRVRDDWGADTFAVRLEVDPDRANMAGITNLDVAYSSAGAMNGQSVGLLREGDLQIPIVARLRADERSKLSDVQNLYVTSLRGADKVPLGQVSRVDYSLQTEKIRRRNNFRTITVGAFPAHGYLTSEVYAAALPEIEALKASLPPGYRIDDGGETEEQRKSFAEMAVVFVLVLVAMYLMLVIQFKSAVKPIVVFAALPFGVLAAIAGLLVTHTPLAFMSLLGIISLLGVIVSHVIVLFDFIEQMRERGEPMRDALIDAGLMRVRPVLITVIATVLALFPLALHGGPLWQPLCYAQIGGLAFATVVTLLLVPVLYTVMIRDLKLIRWDVVDQEETPDVPPAAHAAERAA